MSQAKERVFSFRTGVERHDSPTFSVEPDWNAEPTFFQTERRRPFSRHFGDRADLESGLYVPRTLRLNREMKAIPKLLSQNEWIAVSADIRAIIEMLEPGIHAFTPEIPVQHADGRPSEHRYFGLAWGRALVGTISAEHSRMSPPHEGSVYKRLHPRHVALASSGDVLDKALTIRAEQVRDCHLWYTPDYYNAWFCSGTLREALKGIGLRNVRFHEQNLVAGLPPEAQDRPRPVRDVPVVKRGLGNIIRVLFHRKGP